MSLNGHTYLVPGAWVLMRCGVSKQISDIHESEFCGRRAMLVYEYDMGSSYYDFQTTPEYSFTPIEGCEPPIVFSDDRYAYLRGSRFFGDDIIAVFKEDPTKNPNAKPVWAADFNAYPKQKTKEDILDEFLNF